MKRWIGSMIACGIAGAVIWPFATAPARSGAVLPNGWILRAPSGPMTETDTMPQGAAASPDGRRLAVLDGGFNTPSLRLYAIPSLEQVAEISLPDAFGRPVWLDGHHVLAAGASADVLFDIDVDNRVTRTIALPRHSYPVAIAFDGKRVAVGTDGDLSVRVGDISTIANSRPVRVGGHIGGLAFDGDGTLFAANSSGHDVIAVDSTQRARRIATGLHPSALLCVGATLYVAQSDDDSIGVYDTATGRRIASIPMSPPGFEGLDGSSPNALARAGTAVLASLGAANQIVELRNRVVVARIAAGWYPTDVVPLGEKLYIIDGKGEGTTPNPYFDPKSSGSYDYVAALQYGSIRDRKSTR